MIVQVQGLQPANEKDAAGRFLGFLAMVAACFLSGFAGVWYALLANVTSYYLLQTKV